VAVTITAVGAALSAERLAAAFQPLAWLHQPGGVRAGLARARHVVETHGGTLTAHSDGDGKNVTFTMRLPMRQQEPPHEVPGASAIVCPPGLGGVCALVVDDHADARDLIETLLATCHVRVVAVESIGQALDALDQHPIDVILSDIDLREEDGYTLLTRVRARPPDKGGRVPAIAMSARAGPEDRARAVAVGFQTFIAKPIDPAVVLAEVAALVGAS
jgi:CheY-like chemotaxis protein